MSTQTNKHLSEIIGNVRNVNGLALLTSYWYT